MMLLLISMAVAALALRVLAPTASSPSSEDFSGLTLTKTTLTGGKIVPTWVAYISETFDTKDAARWTWGSLADVSGGYFSGGDGSYTLRCINGITVYPRASNLSFTMEVERLKANATLPYLYLSAAGSYAAPYLQIFQNTTAQFWAANVAELARVTISGTPANYYIRITILDECVRFYWSTDGTTWTEMCYASLSACRWLSTHLNFQLGFIGSVAGLSASGLVVRDITPLFAAELPTVSAFEPTGGLNLAALVSITPTLDATGASGTVTLSLQKYSTEHGWTSLGGVADAWTSLGAVTSGVPIDLSSYTMRAGAKLRWKAEFASTDGTLPPPALSGLALAWTSDTSAPSAPTITQLLSSAATGGAVPRPRLVLDSLPSGARHIEIEAERKPAGGAWGGMLPLSCRHALEAGQGYLELMGAQAVEQPAGEESALDLMLPGTWAVGDQVRAKARAVDAMGNASDWTTSSEVDISSNYPAPTITSVIPDHSDEAGGETITINGTGFLAGAAVTFDGAGVSETVVSSVKVTFVSPAHAVGAVTITVTNTDGQAASIGYQAGHAAYIPVLTNGWSVRWGAAAWKARWT